MMWLMRTLGNFIKKHKNPTVNFSTLQHFVFAKVKGHLTKVF